MIISIFFISGCWSQKELNDLSIISAMAIDKNEEGQYIGTVQLVNPGNVAGGLQGGGAGQSPTVTVYSAEGGSVLDSEFNLTSKVSRKLYKAHANLIVISDEIAKDEGIAKLLDAFERDPEIRNTSRIVIAQHAKAGDVLKSLTAIDSIPSEKVNGILKVIQQSKGENMEVTLQEVIKTLTTEGKEPVLSGVKILGDIKEGKKIENVQQTELSTILESDSLAIFKEGKLIDWYKDETSRGVIWILDKIKQTNVSLNWNEKEKSIIYKVIRQKTKLSAATQNALPTITIHVNVEGDIREVRTPVDLKDPMVILDMEKELENEIKRQLEETVTRTQQNKTDIFGFGEVVHRSDPRKWKTMKDSWNDTYFPNLKVQVEVDAFIRRTGLRSNSFLSDMKE